MKFDPVEARRGEIPTIQKNVSESVTAALKRIHSELEVVFSARTETWSLYLIKLYGAVRSDDILLHQFILDGEPDQKFVDRVRRNWRKNAASGNMTKEETRLLFRRQAQAAFVNQQAKREAPLKEFAREMKYWRDYRWKRHVHVSV